MQPISTRRSPESGSSPVVSVSKTISRMIVAARCESPAPHCSDISQNVANLRSRVIESLRAVHDEIGTAPLLGIGHLLGEQCRKLFFRHSGAAERARALHLGGRGNYDDRVAARFCICFEQ